MKQILGFSAFMVFALASVAEADWRQFRGTNVNGVSSEENLPTELSEEAVVWKQKLTGRGLSGPIIVGEKLFLTSSSGATQNRLHVHCYDVNSGKKLWERQFWATGRTMCHNKMCVATPTPSSDGERIFAFYSSNDLACLDLDGNLLWFRGLTYDFPNASNSLGMSSSPVVIDNTLVVQVESDAEAFATGLDVKTGEARWKIERPRRANWTSPTIYSQADGGGKLALLQSSAGVAAVDPQTGEVHWKFDSGASTIPSSVVAGGTVYIPSNGITAIKPNAAGDAFDKVWGEGSLQPATPSPLAYQGKIYTVNRAGALTCADAKNGEKMWQLRLKGPFSSTPIAAGGHLYFFSESGLAQVVKPGEDKGTIVSTHNFGETILCTPAVSNGAIFVRSDEHLWKIGN